MIFIIECFQANYIVFIPEDRLNININLRIHDVPIQKVYTTKSPRVKLVSQLTRKMPYEYIWCRHQMETFSALLAICAGNSPVPVNSPHKDQWRWALMFTLIYARINGWVNNREAGDLRRYPDHYDVIVMTWNNLSQWAGICSEARRHCVTLFSSTYVIPLYALVVSISSLHG